MTVKRRALIKGMGAAGLLGILGGCGRSPSTSAPPPSLLDDRLDEDFPLITALPFGHGVASGDPLADRVIIWTRLSLPTQQSRPVWVNWQLATDPAMRHPVASGQQLCIAQRDWTVKVDVTGLHAATSYYYRFSALGQHSITGRTRTAPADAVDELRLGIVADADYWQGHWPGLGRLADRNDLDLIISCGNLIFNAPSGDKPIRARGALDDPSHIDWRPWQNLTELRRRYALYRTDPSLCRALQQHPWAFIWNTQELDEGLPLEQALQAFWEWTPTRPPQPDGEPLRVNDGSYPMPPRPAQIWRRLDYGPMLDLFCVDAEIHRGERDGVTANSSHLPAGAPSLLSAEQFRWLGRQMLASEQAGKPYRLLLTQDWLSPVTPTGLAPGADIPGLGSSRWERFAVERAQLLRLLRGDNHSGTRVRGNILVAGTRAANRAADLVETNDLASYQARAPTLNPRPGADPENFAAGFQRIATDNSRFSNERANSLGAEFSASSLSAAGLDEAHARRHLAASRAEQLAAVRGQESAIISGSSNCQFIEASEHGYGLIHLTAERALFECWWQDITDPAAVDVLGTQLVMHTADDPTRGLAGTYQDQIDVVSLYGMAVEASQGSRSAEPAPEATLSPR